MPRPALIQDLGFILRTSLAIPRAFSLREEGEVCAEIALSRLKLRSQRKRGEAKMSSSLILFFCDGGDFEASLNGLDGRLDLGGGDHTDDGGNGAIQS